VCGVNSIYVTTFSTSVVYILIFFQAFPLQLLLHISFSSRAQNQGVLWYDTMGLVREFKVRVSLCDVAFFSSQIFFLKYTLCTSWLGSVACHAVLNVSLCPTLIARLCSQPSTTSQVRKKISSHFHFPGSKASVLPIRSIKQLQDFLYKHHHDHGITAAKTEKKDRKREHAMPESRPVREKESKPKKVKERKTP
jgi:hypothetical protein